MVDWQSSGTVAANAASNGKLVHAILGIYLWDWINTLDFDWTLLTGRRKFRWPLVFYFCGRYAMLAALIGFTVALDVRNEINCQALYQVLQVLSNTALGVASINLAIRTMSIWDQNRYINAGLSLLILGQFGIIIRSMFHVNATFAPTSGCTVVSAESNILGGMYIYSMGIDLVLLILTAYKLEFRLTHNGLAKVMVKDGLFYFAFAFIGTLVAVVRIPDFLSISTAETEDIFDQVFSFLDLNTVMALIGNTLKLSTSIPATTFATISACTVARLEPYYANPGNPPVRATASFPVFSNPVNTNDDNLHSRGTPDLGQQSSSQRVN
ncbi:hypothetical protein D9758_008332 [Tetrapyrgos nigripes]|uniref:Uncharacterized protein n=1 Tax=Tetrapyrgos nigripes TaxID=182062 RepID=A0A8H5LML8_9AGAR|nr:hypothetical protein D9758_008332 [Tetrapyrgos nigripes]